MTTLPVFQLWVQYDTHQWVMMGFFESFMEADDHHTLTLERPSGQTIVDYAIVEVRSAR